jgi:large subunit ribosomal protein L37Ae
MERRTVKVGITGKFGTRYGAKLRKQVKAIEILQKTKYICTFCGKNSIRRQATGIWRCKACRRVVAGGAWEFSTSAAQTAKTTINRLKKDAVDTKKADEVVPEEETKAEKKRNKKEGETKPKKDDKATKTKNPKK